MNLSFISTLTRLVALGLAMIALSSHAALIWQADFESYNTTAGAAALTINTTGSNDTFTSTVPNSRIEEATTEVRKTGVPSFMSGNALYISGKCKEADTTSLALQQSAITSLAPGSSGMLVVSFDGYNTSASTVNTLGEARTETGGRAGSSMYASSTTSNTAFRFTIIVNRTGTAITLPASLGQLNTNSAAIYRFDGTNYDKLNVSDGNLGASTTVVGFAAGFSLKGVVGSTYGMWLDNFGAWNSLTDTVNGTNILSLAPGALSSPIPEPSTVALLAGIAVLLGAVATRKLRTRA